MKRRWIVAAAALAGVGIGAVLLFRHRASRPDGLPPGPLLVLARAPAAETPAASPPADAAEFLRLAYPGVLADDVQGRTRLTAVERIEVAAEVSLAVRPNGRLPDNTPTILPRLQNYMARVSAAGGGRGPLASYASVEADGTGRFRFRFGRQVPRLAEVLASVLGERAVVGPTPAARPDAPRARTAVSFHLRPDARFADGAPLTAADLGASFESARRLPDGHPLRERTRCIAALSVKGERELRVESDDPGFRLLALGWTPLTRGGRPAGPGLGPLWIEGPGPGGSALCRVGGPPAPFTLLRAWGVPDAGLRARLGRQDGVAAVETDAAAAPAVEGRSGYSRRLLAVAFNCRRLPWTDATVRRALAAAVPAGSPANPRSGPPARTGPVDPLALPGRPSAPFPSGLDEARALLHRAGWADRDGDGIRDLHGAPLRFRLLTDASRPGDESLAGRIASAWDPLGARAVVTPLPSGAFRQALAGREFEAALVRLPSPPAVDPWVLWHSSQWKGGDAGAGNLTGYARGEVDAALEAYGMWLDPAERAAALARVDALVREDAPAAFIAWEETILLTRDPGLGRRLSPP